MTSLLLALLTTAPAAEPLAGDTITGGLSPVTLTLVPSDRGTVRAELWWQAFDRATIGEVIPLATTCDPVAMEGGLARLPSPQACLDQRVHSPHPIYDYVSRDRLHCVLGRDDDGALAMCKLPFTGWFELREKGSPDRERSEDPPATAAP